MTFVASVAPILDEVDSVFDFSRAVPARPTVAALAARRGDPEPGWATANPARAMLFLFVSPRDGAVVDELLAL